MVLLGIETSTENCSAAVMVRDEIISIAEVCSQRHAELILPMIDEVLGKMGVERGDLEGIAYGMGPGAFTGVRVAASTAQALAQGLKLKCAGVSSLEALALQALYDRDEEYAVSAIDARMGELYVCVYRYGRGLEPLFEPKVLKVEEARELIRQSLGVNSAVGGGSGMDLLYAAGLNKNIQKRSQFPDAEYIVKLGELLFKAGKEVDPSSALPTYVRDEVAKKPAPRKGK
ncbi:MAG: tRNA (adenosine(37)-N6)-threonylcarbamoyltransferase complex dimerization subunit type 1 TsaB [Succinivibrio sp.]|nr:tRNA (adenosine(37)-N6)-threonylcarbamoyltransferase complex dimerization subunit type 1 TsaB [Succinivibrio sp.]